ncbi:hypothetical protein F52700_1574 [Fusarium sp. NRRL 52700]|nr:hypothetical protein F52700_1574 [Fusarium sp. NRRL 52700]
MSSPQNPFEDSSHSIRGMLRALSVRQQEKNSGDCKSWSLEEIQQEYEILLKKYKDNTLDQNYLVKAKEITNARNVANQCREWVHDCKKTFQSLEEAQAAILQACKHPEPDNVHLAMKGISDADKRISALQTQIRGYVDAVRQWLDKEPGF